MPVVPPGMAATNGGPFGKSAIADWMMLMAGIESEDRQMDVCDGVRRLWLVWDALTATEAVHFILYIGKELEPGFNNTGVR